MALDRQPTDGTDLIDVSDLAQEFDEATIPDEEQEISGAELLTGIEPPSPSSRGAPTVASLKDRFAAALIDTILLSLLYWSLAILYRTIAFGIPLGPVPAAGLHGLLFHGLFLFLALVAGTFFEGVLLATPGKFICGLQVRKIDGGGVGFGGAMVRNLFLPFDLLLLPLIIGIAILEKSAWHRRLGDIIAKTIVLSRTQTPPPAFHVTKELLASSSGRLVAFCIDELLRLAALMGLLLCLSPDNPLMSMILILFAPIFIFCLIFIPESATATSPGKWIMGYTICQEDGSPISTASSIIRTIFRVLDTNPMGFVGMLISRRTQRFGDTAAGTVVLRVPRHWRGAVGFAILFFVAATMLWAGLGNRHNFLTKDFEVNFLPSIDIGEGITLSHDASPKNLYVESFKFAAGQANLERKPSIFQPGETVFLVFTVAGHTLKEDTAWIREDLSVRYPDGTEGLKLEGIIDFHNKVAKSGPIEFTNNIVLPVNALPGRYSITISLHDMHSNNLLKEQRFLYVTPPETKTTPSGIEEQNIPPIAPSPPPAEGPSGSLPGLGSPDESGR